MSGAEPITPELFEEAADWFIRVRTAEAGADVHAAWLAWVEKDSAHRAAFSAVQEAWDVSGTVQTFAWLTPEEPVEPKAASSPGRFSHVARLPARVALAAGIAIVGLVAALTIPDAASRWLGNSTEVHKRIATGRGEPQSAVLPDGSRLELGGLTGVEVVFTSRRRLILADEGETFYKVHHDPNRPFIVEAGPVRVTAIGTAFSVRREGNEVSVEVVEGVVDLNTDPDVQSVTELHDAAGRTPRVRAKAGQRVKFDGARFLQAADPGAAARMAWRRGQLRFEEEPLDVVIASLNRYSTRRIVLGDPALKKLRFTGTVYDDSVEDWLQAVQIVFPVELGYSDPERIVIEPRH